MCLKPVGLTARVSRQFPRACAALEAGHPPPSVTNHQHQLRSGRMSVSSPGTPAFKGPKFSGRRPRPERQPAAALPASPRAQARRRNHGNRTRRLKPGAKSRDVGVGPEGGAGGSRDGLLGRGRRAGVGPDLGGWVRGRGDMKWGVSLERAWLYEGAGPDRGRGARGRNWPLGRGRGRWGGALRRGPWDGALNRRVLGSLSVSQETS